MRHGGTAARLHGGTADQAVVIPHEELIVRQRVGASLALESRRSVCNRVAQGTWRDAQGTSRLSRCKIAVRGKHRALRAEKLRHSANMSPRALRNRVAREQRRVARGRSRVGAASLRRVRELGDPRGASFGRIGQSCKRSAFRVDASPLPGDARRFRMEARRSGWTLLRSG